MGQVIYVWDHFLHRLEEGNREEAYLGVAFLNVPITSKAW